MDKNLYLGQESDKLKDYDQKTKSIMSNDHFSKQYEHDLQSIQSSTLQMGGLVESQLRDAVTCFKTHNIALAEAVIERDQQVNRMEIDLDEACAYLIARRQPVAGDLRIVLATMKIITDLERIGDESAKIARIVRALDKHGHNPSDDYQTVYTAAEIAWQMLKEALNAYARLDGQQASEVISKDRMINENFRIILEESTKLMMQNSQTVFSAMDIIWIAKAIERIGDHAKNISQYVVYIVGGEDIRHSRRAESGI